MHQEVNTQKSISSNRSVLTHSEVMPAKKSGGLGTSTKSCSTVDIKQEKILLIMINVKIIDHTSML
jgi:hypothetical protein